jgi:hypothetical protein
MKNLGQCLRLLFTYSVKTAMLAFHFCKNGCEKYPMPFTNVVEDCKIYNFHIGHSGEFS